jgi:hypothetical protein
MVTQKISMTKNNKIIIKNADAAFDKIAAKHSLTHKKVRGVDAVVIRMARNYAHSGKMWHFAYEFMGACRGGDGIWGSHKAPARISDVWVQYPQLVEMRKIGQEAVYRLRLENISPASLLEMRKVTYRLP